MSQPKLITWEKDGLGYRIRTGDMRHGLQLRWAQDVLDYIEELLDDEYYLPENQLQALRACASSEEADYNAWMDDLAEKEGWNDGF